ncbi:3D domain-containing protein [Salinisphaera shabanensis]|uniref:3D domain-containing protein n=1 Tax=Salinisphaera shabanensis TaxID=180542 RepID=UPI0033402776
MTVRLSPSLRRPWLAGVVLAIGVMGCTSGEADSAVTWETLEVTATSFTLAEEETKRGNIGLTAFGDQLEPGDKAIAVSRDLIRLGLTHGTKVRVEGLPGTYTVQDKMHRRWRNKIDILFTKRKRALEWGRKNIEIQYQVADAG